MAKSETGKLVGQNWIWPDGRKTHIRFIAQAISRYKPLPKGFYAEVKRLNTKNLNFLAMKAKSLGLKDTVLEP